MISPQVVPVRSASELLAGERTGEVRTAGGLPHNNEDKGKLAGLVVTQEKTEANLLLHTNNSSSSVASLTKFPFQSCQPSPKNTLNQSRSRTSICAENFGLGMHGSDEPVVMKRREMVSEFDLEN